MKLPIALLAFLFVAGCGKLETSPRPSFAIFAEFAKNANIPMKNGLNRRVFNTVEAQSGSDIALEKDGSIALRPGTYRINGFSIATMQAKLTPPASHYNTNYPGYCVVYERDFEANDPLHHQIGIGSPSTAREMTPSLFDLVFTCTKVTHLCVGHQSGDALNSEVYLSVYDVGGITSPFHVFARIAVFKL